MTIREYYNDSYCTQFDANIVERLWVDQKPAIILDKTFFYPSSGGQPNDLGTIQGLNVVDVFVRKSDQQIVHTLSDSVSDEVVVGKIDWARRFDHMQQHTGQHTLSQAFLRLAKSDTVSFHLGQDTSTLDLAISQLSRKEISDVELFANRTVWEDRPVHIKYASLAEAESLPLRKTPDRLGTKLRLIEIADFDLTACGGTHVASLGEIGLIKIVKSEHRSKGLRIEFRCGQRALVDYELKSQVVSQLMADLTTAADELPSAVRRLSEEVKDTNRLLKRRTKQLMALEAANLLQEGSHFGDLILVTSVFLNRDPAELRTIAKNLVARDNTVVFLGNAGDKSLLLFASAENVQVEMNSALNLALPLLGTASGGGSAKFAQGGGIAADQDKVVAALQEAERFLIRTINQSQIAI